MSISPAENPLHSVATEFVTESFETEVAPTAVNDLAAEIETIVRDLRGAMTSDDRLESLLLGKPGGTVLTSDATVDREDPEPLTRRKIVEPLLGALGYGDLSVEAGDLSPERGRQADYAIDLRPYEGIDSNRLLVEAEPLNKRLDSRTHGVGQVEDWLERDKFEANFGMATDGVRWALLKYDRDTYSFDTLAEVSLQPVFVAAFENLVGEAAPTDEWLDDGSREVLAEFARAFSFENVRSIAGEAREVIKRTKQAITDEFYDEYVRLVFGITDNGDGRTARSLIGDGVVPPDDATGDDVRLFAVKFMNRLIFIKFLEDKELVEPTLLRDLLDDHDDGLNPDSFYETYLEPLFFGVLDERPTERSERVRAMTVYEDVPYLNGGLFRPTVEDGKEFDQTDFDVRDSVVTAIVDLLESYSFSADGSPTDLDPSVLGNVFEKTINHLTTGSGDRKKELGAYYTPDEITRFCAERTVKPALLERFKTAIVEEWGWKQADVDHYEDVYNLVDALPENRDLVDLLLGVVDQFRALDPACGSGHFLTSVQGEIVAIRKALYEKHPDDPADWELHKQTVVRNVYGVDLVEPAVEIAKLRLWLSIIAEVDPEEVHEYDEEELALPNVVFNVRQGNSLIGFTGLVETDAEGINAQLESFTPNNVENRYGGVIELVEKHRETTDTEAASKYLRYAERLIDEFGTDLDSKVLSGFHQAGFNRLTTDDVQDYDPFHWVLEFAIVYKDGGFDAIVGNPPWDRLRPTRDEFFSRYDADFASLMPEEKDARQQEMLEGSGPELPGDLDDKWEQYQRNIEIQTKYFRDSGAYERQSPEIDGKTEATENDLSALFLERVCELTKDGGYLAQVLPGSIFNGASTKDLRMHLLTENRIQSLAVFENRGIFPEIDSRYNFGVISFEAGGTTDTLTGIFRQRDLDILQNLEGEALTIPSKVLAEFSPAARIFPYVQKQEEVSVLEKIVGKQPIADSSDDSWFATPYRELDRTNDADRFIETSEGGDYPVYGGSNVFQFVPDSTYFGVEPPEFWSVDEDEEPARSAKRRIREKNVRNLKRELYDAFDGSGSQKSFVNDKLEKRRGEPLSENDVLLDCTEYRIVFRDIARATDERTIIASVIPDGVVCHNTLHTIRPYEINPDETDLTESPLHGVYERVFTDSELFVTLGLINSVPFDFLMRTKVDSHIVMYKFKESQVPRLTSGDNWFEYISSRAARLNCYGEAFAEMRERLGGIEPATEEAERKRLQAEIDAAAFHAYDLNREETAFVLDDFHRVREPRMMTEDYFDTVLAKYDDLAEDGPKA